MSRGLLIEVEGIDGAGKAKQADLLAKKIDALVFPFPNYKTETGQAILGNLQLKWEAAQISYRTVYRSFEAALGGSPAEEAVHAADPLLNAMVLQALQLANRYEIADEIYEQLESGRHVVLDRYWPSGYVYGVCDGLDATWLRRIHSSLPVPDVMFLLDVPPEESVRRRPERRDRYEKDGLMGRRREIYLSLWNEQMKPVHDFTCPAPEDRCDCDTKTWRIIDGLGTPEEVHERILKVMHLPQVCGASHSIRGSR